MSVVTPPALLRSVAGDGLNGHDPLDLLRASFAGQPGRSLDRSRLTRTLLLDLQLALPDLMFLYFDKMSMATSLEVRVPFADHELVNFCMALPDDRRIRRVRGKEILRRISTDLVDESIITRPKRGFFRGGASSWLAARSDLIRDTLSDERCRQRGLLDPDALAAWSEQSPGTGRAGEPLLAAFLLERWHRVFVDGDGRARSRTAEAGSRGLPSHPVTS